MNRPTPYGSISLGLSKSGICLSVALSAFTGYVLAAHHADFRLWLLLPGVFSLATGASSLNQYQERSLDARMMRTRMRPLPSGKISPPQAILFSLTLAAAGFVLVLSAAGAAAAVLGIAAIIWYNGVYTFLKKRTAFAVVPGAMVGAFPPAIGWVAGGGNLRSHELIVLCMFLFMWQLPHFWLIVLRYSLDYEQAGLPTLREVFSERQIARITAQWIFCLGASTPSLCLSGSARNPVTAVPICLASLWLIGSGSVILSKRKRSGEGIPYPALFAKINIFLFLVLILLSMGTLLSGVSWPPILVD